MCLSLSLLHPRPTVLNYSPTLLTRNSEHQRQCSEWGNLQIHIVQIHSARQQISHQTLLFTNITSFVHSGGVEQIGMGLGSEQKLPFWGNQLILYYLALVPKVFFVLNLTRSPQCVKLKARWPNAARPAILCGKWELKMCLTAS